MKLELVLLLVNKGGRANADAEGVYRPLYESTYVHTQVCTRNGLEWAFVDGSWTLLRTEDSGLRYVVVAER